MGPFDSFPSSTHRERLCQCYMLPKPPVNNSYDLNVGSVTESCNCSSFKNSSTALFALPGQSFVCGNNLAFSYLPQNWTEPPGPGPAHGRKRRPMPRLNEQCCFYANRSGIVRDKIKTLQEDLAKRRKALQDNPCGAGLMDFSPTSFLSLGLFSASA
ncbi:envelope glycoprotein [Plecturocebus cupreus]